MCDDFKLYGKEIQEKLVQKYRKIQTGRKKMKLPAKAKLMAMKQIFKQYVQSVDKIFMLKQFVSMPPWFTKIFIN